MHLRRHIHTKGVFYLKKDVNTLIFYLVFFLLSSYSNNHDKKIIILKTISDFGGGKTSEQDRYLKYCEVYETVKLINDFNPFMSLLFKCLDKNPHTRFKLKL